MAKKGSGLTITQRANMSWRARYGKLAFRMNPRIFLRTKKLMRGDCDASVKSRALDAW